MLVLLILVTFLFALGSPILAQTNNQISIQGRIVDGTDGTNPVTATTSCIAVGADTCDLRADIYSDAVGGTLLWSEIHPDTELGDNAGIFNLKLNSSCNDWSTPAVSGNCNGGAGIDWGTDPTLYVEILFDTDGNGDFVGAEVFTRSEFTSVPFAYYADLAGGVIGGLDTVYDNDTNQALDVDNLAGLEFISTVAGDITFDLQSTGDITFQDNDTTFLTISDTGGLQLDLDSTDNPSFIINNAGTNTAIDLNQTGEGTALDITSGATASDVVSIDGQSLITGDALQVIYDSANLTSGYALRITDDSTDRLTLGDGGALNWLGEAGSNAQFTTGNSNDLFNVLDGNLKVGDGTPDNALDGEDVYIEDSLEVDGTTDFGADVDFNSNEAIAFRIENADGSVSVPLCDAANQGRQYYDTDDDNGYICIESAPSTYSWFNLTQTLAATATKVVTVGTSGDYASIAAAAGYLNTLTGGIILLAPQTHNVTNAVDLDNLTLIGANIEDTVINITGNGALRSRQTQFENLTISVDPGITASSGIDMILEAGANSTITFNWVNFDINGAKFLIDSTEATAPTIEARFESSSATTGTGSIVPDQGSANLNGASGFTVSSQGDSGALNFADWDVSIAGSGNVVTTGVITTTPENTIFVYPGMNLEGAVSSLPVGGVITLLPGTHSITSPINITSDSIKIIGYGDASVISASGFTGGAEVAAIQIGAQDGTNPANNVVLQDFKLEVDGTGASDIHGIRVAGGDDNRVLDVTVQKISGQSGTGTGARIGIFFIDGTVDQLVRPVVKGSRVIGNGGTNYFTDGIHITGGQDYGFAGIWMNGAGVVNALVESNNVDYVRETAAVFIGVEDSSLYNNRFSRMGQGSTGPFGVFMGNSTRINMTANVVTGTLVTGTIAIGIDAVTAAFGPTFSDVVFTSNVLDGTAAGGSGFATGFDVGNGTNSDIDRLTFQNNIIRGASTAVTTRAFNIEGDFDSSIISNNSISGGANTWDDGIFIQSAQAERNILRGNTFEGVTDNIDDNGTDTKQGVAQHQNTVDPTVNDDESNGYTTGTLWINTTTDESFISVDDTTGAAIWNQIDGAGGGPSGTIAYGELYSTGGAGQSIATTWTQINQFTTVGDASGTTPSAASDNITINEDGVYKIELALSLENSATVDLDIAVFLNGVIMPDLQADDFIFNGEKDSIILNGIESLSNGDVLDVRLQAAPTQTITVNESNFNVSTLAGGSISGGAGELDDVYSNDTDKILNVDNAAGLEFVSSTAGNITFDLQSTGDFIIEDSGTPLFAVLDDGSVGIQTNTPLAALDINSAGSAIAPSLIFEGDTDTGIFHPTGNNLAFAANGNEQLRITDNGLRFGGKTSDPGLPQEGDLWFRSDTDNLKFFADGRTQEIQAVAVAQVYESGTTVINGSTPIDWDGANAALRIVDSTYSHATGVNPSEVTINDSGLYKISYNISWDTTANSRRTNSCQMLLNGSAPTPVVGTSHAYSRNNTDDWESNTSTFMYSFTAGDVVEIACESTGSTGSLTTLANQSYMSIELVRRQ